MTEETAVMAERVLLELGFADKREEHPWNMVQFEKDFGKAGTLTIWGRHWSHLIVQVYPDEETAFDLVETEDESVLRSVLTKAEEFLKFLSGLPGNEAEVEA